MPKSIVEPRASEHQEVHAGPAKHRGRSELPFGWADSRVHETIRDRSANGLPLDSAGRASENDSRAFDAALLIQCLYPFENLARSRPIDDDTQRR